MMIGEGVGLSVSPEAISSPFLPSRILAARYDRLFHFFFSKTIKRLVDRDECKELSLLKEYQFWDDDREMLKRSYDTQEFMDRIGILAEISHPQPKFHVIEPVVTREPFRKIMLKRTKRIKKYERKLQEIEEQVPVTFESKFLDTIDSTSQAYEISYDSSFHNIFTDFKGPESDRTEKMAKVCVRGIPIFSQPNQILAQPPKQLVMDFDDVDEEDIVSKYKKLSSRQSFNKKYPQQPKPSHNRKRIEEQTKALSRQLKPQQFDVATSSKVPGQISPKAYNYNRVLDQQLSGKRLTYIEVGNHSLDAQNQSKRDTYKPATLLQLNHNKQVPVSVRSPTSNTTQFNTVRKRALELLSEDSMNGPKFAKAKSPAAVSNHRVQK